MNELEYGLALRACSALVNLDPPADSDAGRALADISVLVETHEKLHFKFATPSQAELDAFRKQMMGDA